MSAALRLQIEASLASRIPSALTPITRDIRQVEKTGIQGIDDLLGGGLPLGAITELTGPECSGRTGAAFSFIALRTQQAKVCAWIDTSDSLDPASAAWSGVDLQRLLWVRCGGAQRQGKKPWTRIEQTLRAGDLLLQGGGFSTLVFDLGSFEPEQVSRIPLATWFRFRALAEKTQASILLLTQHGCAKSSAALLLRLETGTGTQTESTIFSGITHQLAVARQRFDPSPVTPIKKPSQRVTSWQSQTAWSGQR